MPIKRLSLFFYLILGWWPLTCFGQQNVLEVKVHPRGAEALRGERASVHSMGIPRQSREEACSGPSDEAHMASACLSPKMTAMEL